MKTRWVSNTHAIRVMAGFDKKELVRRLKRTCGTVNSRAAGSPNYRRTRSRGSLN